MEKRGKELAACYVSPPFARLLACTRVLLGLSFAHSATEVCLSKRHRAHAQAQTPPPPHQLEPQSELLLVGATVAVT